MDVCFIPPCGLEGRIDRGDSIMVLAQLATFTYSPYVNAIRKFAPAAKRIIIDNGANEGTEVPWYRLYDVATVVQGHEIILPDKLHDGGITIERAQRYLDTCRPGWADSKMYMGVAQGRNMNEVKTCIAHFVELDVRTIGLPRLLITPEERSIRIDLANWIVETYPGRFDIHLLGTSPVWISEVKYAAKYASHIRSVDTSAPYNYAFAGKLLTSGDQVGRPDYYFDRDWWIERVAADPKCYDLIKQNEETLLEWAHQ